jgi:SOS response regulatory protein OraA/RecX
MELAIRSLGVRDSSRDRLAERLARAKVPPATAGGVLGELEAAGYLDDGRLARSRAAALCERGWGDEAILARLAADGIADEAARTAVDDLPPEAERAARLEAATDDARRLVALLARRGFSPALVEEAAARLDADG